MTSVACRDENRFRTDKGTKKRLPITSPILIRSDRIEKKKRCRFDYREARRKYRTTMAVHRNNHECCRRKKENIEQWAPRCRSPGHCSSSSAWLPLYGQVDSYLVNNNTGYLVRVRSNTGIPNCWIIELLHYCIATMDLAHGHDVSYHTYSYISYQVYVYDTNHCCYCCLVAHDKK